MTRTRRTATLLGAVLTLGLIAALLVPLATRSTSAAPVAPSDTIRITAISGVSEGAAVSGAFPVVADVSGTVAQVVFTLDGPKPVVRTERGWPYSLTGDADHQAIPWDTRQFPNGAYVLTVTATDSAGAGDQRIVRFSVANGTVPAPTVAAPTAAAPTAVPTAAPAPPASGTALTISSISGVRDGGNVAGSFPVVAEVSGGTAAQVVFRLDGPKPLLRTERGKPYSLTGDANGQPYPWNTTQFPDGAYVLTVTATDSAGRSVQRVVRFGVANLGAPVGSVPTAAPVRTAVPTAAPVRTAVPTAAPAPTAAPSGEPPLLPGPSHTTNIGPQFTILCSTGARRNDDPIVFPGQPGASHEHLFFGATGADAGATYQSLRDGDTSCADTGDTAGYWIPVLYGPDGAAVNPRRVRAYYYANAADRASLRAFPRDLRIIAGSAKATGPQPAGVVNWLCRDRADQAAGLPLAGANPPRCNSDEFLSLTIRFPDCWDGVRLDSSDHRRHMAYSDAQTRCPSTHPVKVPKLRLSITYEVASFTGGNFTLGAPPNQHHALAWYAMHADFWNTWDQGALDEYVNGCLKQGRSVRGTPCNT